MAGSTLASPTADPAIVGIDRVRHVSLAGEAWRRFRRHRLAVASLAVLALMILAVAAGPLVWQIPINDIDFGARLAGPSWAHPFGTDDLGQDLFARMLYGGRISLSVGLSAMAVAVVVGIVAGSVDVAAAIILESTLSFLGLGFPPDIPTWGRILFDAKDYLDIAPHWALFPGAAIFLAVLTINYIGDGLRDTLDPRRVM